MLMALLDGVHVLARDSEKGSTYLCPDCNCEVTLKKGRKVTHYFAHKPPVTCSLAKGETVAHLESKLAFYDHFKSLGLSAEVEYPLSFNDIRSRADVYVKTTNGMPAALEIQHTNISLDEIERRTQNYSKLGVAVGWIPLLDLDKHEVDVESSSKGWVINKYSPKPYEIWIHGFNFGKVWYYEPKENTIWEGILSPYTIDVPTSEWYEEGGNFVSVGGYSKFSKRWRVLTISGMYALSDVQFSIQKRQAKTLNVYNFPSCHMVKITPKWAIKDKAPRR